jgi:adenine-specific DNA-methyltransferase
LLEASRLIPTIEASLPAFGLNWPGRAQAFAHSDEPATGTLTFVPGESINADTAWHRFIEGDNLEVLKGLQGEFSERIKLIYIDPPYNTGNGLVYADNFRMSSSDWAKEPGVGTSGRLHANWLSMMLPRLTLARRLLSETGVIFVSIDDREVHHLRLLMNEVFGEENFVSSIIWRKKVVRGRGARHVLPQTEYILVYAKKIGALPPFSEPLTDAMRAEYAQSDELGPYKLIPLAKSGTSHSPRPNLVYPITAPDGSAIPCPTHQWRWSQGTLEAKRSEVVFRQSKNGKWLVFSKQRMVLAGAERRRTPNSYYDRYTTTDGTREMKLLFGRVVLDFPKPSGLIRDLLVWASAPGDWVLDFFAGSCPTAQAVLELNKLDSGARRFICVQRPEPLDDPEFKTISDIGKARIARVIARLDDGQGVRVFTYQALAGEVPIA